MSTHPRHPASASALGLILLLALPGVLSAQGVVGANSIAATRTDGTAVPRREIRVVRRFAGSLRFAPDRLSGEAASRLRGLDRAARLGPP